MFRKTYFPVMLALAFPLARCGGDSPSSLGTDGGSGGTGYGSGGANRPVGPVSGQDCDPKESGVARCTSKSFCGDSSKTCSCYAGTWNCVSDGDQVPPETEGTGGAKAGTGGSKGGTGGRAGNGGFKRDRDASYEDQKAQDQRAQDQAAQDHVVPQDRVAPQDQGAPDQSAPTEDATTPVDAAAEADVACETASCSLLLVCLTACDNPASARACCTCPTGYVNQTTCTRDP